MTHELETIDHSDDNKTELSDLLRTPEKFSGQTVTVTGDLDSFKTYATGCIRIVHVAEGYVKTEEERLYFELNVADYNMPSRMLEQLKETYKDRRPVTLKGTFFKSDTNGYMLSVRSVQE